jgi:7-carboxy-7-deazaguanine synthase
MTHDKKHRVAEIFGPTIQGEGRNVGMPCHFVRFGGCDFRCDWCDTPHAVLPDLVAKLPKMTDWEIVGALRRLDRDGDASATPVWIVLSGGNPALRDLDGLIDLLHSQKKKVMLETQGSVYRQWFGKVDDLCFSPKPPSSKMDWDFDNFDKILTELHKDNPVSSVVHPPYLKVPVFTYADLEFAARVHQTWPYLEFFVSIGNDDPSLPTVGNPNPVVDDSTVVLTRDVVLDNFADWTEAVLLRQEFADCRIFPQQHTLIWGNERGR